MAFLVMLLLGGAFALQLSSGASPAQRVRAAQGLSYDLSVVSQPTLPAATVNAIFARLGSPMAGSGAVVEKASRQTGIDDAFALAVWWTETNDGAAGVGLADRNPGSVRGSVGYPSAYDGYTIYPSFTDAIVYWFSMLRNRYVNNGLNTVYAISHPYVGTSTSYLWAGKVINLMLRYRGEAPPPTPIPTLAPSPTFSPLLPHHHRASNPYGWNTSPESQQTQPGTLTSDTSQADQIALSQQASLSRAITWAIAAIALLLALAIALWAGKLSIPTPAYQPYQSVQPAWQETTPAMLQPVAAPAPLLRLPTRPLPATPVPSAFPESPFARMPETPGKLRRTVLLPSQKQDAIEHQAVEEEGTVGITRRPTGLLARYGK